MKDNKIVSIEEFRILENYAHTGQIWTVVKRFPFVTQQRALEYIFDSETLLAFTFISQNILATWETDATRNFGLNDEFYIGHSLYIRPYGSWCI